MRVYILKDGSTEIRDTERGIVNFELIHKDEIKSKFDTVSIFRRG